MWKKAEDLLNRKDAVTHASGGDAKARMILSSSDICPHFVHTCQPFNGQFMCDCHNYKTFSLCSHSLVTATVNDALGDFLEWHTMCTPCALGGDMITLRTQKNLVATHGRKRSTCDCGYRVCYAVF